MQKLWRQIVNDRISHPAAYIEALGSLCEFLIEELEISNDLEILNELNPLIIRWQNIAEKTQSHSWLAWTKLFQAKVALIAMKIEESTLTLPLSSSSTPAFLNIVFEGRMC